jgi:hypothetical protein
MLAAYFNLFRLEYGGFYAPQYYWDGSRILRVVVLYLKTEMLGLLDHMLAHYSSTVWEIKWRRNMNNLINFENCLVRSLYTYVHARIHPATYITEVVGR